MKKLSLVLFIALSTFTLYKCNQEAEPESLTGLKEFPELLMVKRSSFNSFYNDLTTFTQGLTVEQKTLLDDYVATKHANAKANEVAPTCECAPGQTTCTADGFFGGCCVCCPSNRAANCRVTVGVPICECEDSPPPAKNGVNQDDQVFDEKYDAMLIKIKPHGINEMFNFGAQNGIDASNIKKSLEKLVNSAN
jgi:hypothetical protein